ncbi:MAG: hypothetical protein ABSE49_31840 [Polyangiaceae bacterium]
MLQDTASLSSSSNDDDWDNLTNTYYQKYVNENIFAPSGVAPAESFPSSTSAYGYLQGSPYAGTVTPNTTGQVASGGWYLSVNDVLNIAGAFRRNGLLDLWSFGTTSSSAFLPDNVLNQFFGIDYATTISSPGSSYTYFSKNGCIPVKIYGHDPTTMYGSSVNSYIWFFPYQTEMALLINSAVGPFPPATNWCDSGNDEPRILLQNLVMATFPKGAALSMSGLGGSCCGPWDWPTPLNGVTGNAPVATSGALGP